MSKKLTIFCFADSQNEIPFALPHAFKKTKAYVCQNLLNSKLLVLSKMLTVLLLFSMVSPSLLAQQILQNYNATVATLQNQNLEFRGVSTLTLTGNAASNPLNGSTINMTSPDVWIFFTSMRPNEVINSQLSHIRTGGTAATTGGNVRIVEYLNGTAVINQSSTFQPLTVYVNNNLSGTFMNFSTETYYKNAELGSMNDNIQSFKLKRGYMATFASNEDGSGVSRVYVADNNDITINTMPVGLSNTASLVIVRPWSWVTKKGWAGGQTEAGFVDATWNYDWSSSGSSIRNCEYTPHKWGASWPGWGLNDKKAVTHVLGYNEPDHTDQANVSYATALANLPQFYVSGLRVCSPATSDPFNGWNEINFIRECNDDGKRIDVMAIHAYWNKTASQWYNDLKYLHERTGKPIWITEWNNGANWTTNHFPNNPSTITDANATTQLNDIKAILNVLDTSHFIERYSIYNWVQDARAMILTIDSSFMARNTNFANYQWLQTAPVVQTKPGKLLNGTIGNVNIVLTPAGQYYRDNASKMSYTEDYYNDLDILGGTIIQENTTGFCSVDGVIDNDYDGYTGSGAANTDKAVGKGISYKVNFTKAGAKTFNIRYSSTNSRPGNLLINGTMVASNIQFPATGGFNQFVSFPVTVYTDAGLADVRLQATTSDGLGNVDYIQITDATGINCSIQTRVYDFGTATSPLATGAARVTESTSLGTGFGWISTPGLQSRDRGTGSDIQRDFVYSNTSHQFAVNVANGTYYVSIVQGDAFYAHNNMSITAEGTVVVSDINTEMGEFVTTNFSINVTDGQLTLGFADAGGSDPNWIVNAITVSGNSLPAARTASTTISSNITNSTLEVAMDKKGFEQERNTITLYPNPVGDKLYVSLPDSFRNGAEILIVNALGQIVFKDKTHGNTLTEVNVSGMVQAVYFVKVYNGSSTLIRSFVKK